MEVALEAQGLFAPDVHPVDAEAVEVHQVVLREGRPFLEKEDELVLVPDEEIHRRLLVYLNDVHRDRLEYVHRCMISELSIKILNYC
jgi:hypothetical protein